MSIDRRADTQYDDPTPCPECGIGDEEFGLHEPDCPSGYPTRDVIDPVGEAVREFEDENRYGPF